MLMPGRKYMATIPYRYGFNGQVKSTEINDNSYTAEYWQYDARLGRRWNLDPRPNVSLSPYAAFANNPIFNSDPLGDTTVPMASGGTATLPDDISHQMSFYAKGGNYVMAGTNTPVPVEQGQLRGFKNFLGEFTARWKTNEVGAAEFLGYKNESNLDFNGAIKKYNSEQETLATLEKINKFFSDPVNQAFLIAAPLEIQKAMFTSGSRSAVNSSVIKSEFKAAAQEAVITAPNGKFYSVAFEMNLKATSYPGVTRYMHFQEANVALNAAMKTNPFLGQLGISVPRSSAGSIIGKSPTNWVWHHDVKTGVMQLAPKSQHPNIPGGIFWETMHPGGVGGYSTWGK